MISRRPTSIQHSPKTATLTRCASDLPTTAGLMPLSAAQLCIHISEAGGKEPPRRRRPRGVSQEALRQALYLLLQRPHGGRQRGGDELGSHSLEELIDVYAREYSDWENLKARQIVAELNVRFAWDRSAPRLHTDADTRLAAGKS